MVCHSLLQWTTFCQTSPPWPIRFWWPHTAWLGFIELDKAVVLVWSDWLFSVIMVSVCLPSDALSQHLPSYVGFSYLGCGVCLDSGSSKAQPLPVGIHSMMQRLLTRCSVAAWSGWGRLGDGREVQEGGDICIPMADSCWYTAETNTCCKAIILRLKIYNINQKTRNSNNKKVS